MTDKEVWFQLRRCLIDILSVMERYLEIAPTTSEMRRSYISLYQGSTAIPRGADDSPSPAQGDERVGADEDS